MNTSWVPQFLIVLVPFFTALLACYTALARIRAAREKPKKHGTLNGYAPMFSDLLDRLEQYRRDNEVLRVENATLRERVDGYNRRRKTQTQQPPSTTPSNEGKPPRRTPSRSRTARPNAL